jgi:hypothetical protein
MLERFRRTDSGHHHTERHDGATAVAERDTRQVPVHREGTTPVTHAHDARAAQHDEFGGINWGAAFFGWLVAVGLGALLAAIVAAAGTAIGLSTEPTTADAETIGLAGGIALLVVMLIAYYAGGYVAGRMSRFDGAKQGLATWLWGLLIAIALAAVALIAGSEYNVLSQLNLPDLPVGERELTTGGIIATVAIVLGTLLAAIAGGIAGTRYHRKVDRVGYEGRV